MCDLNPFFCLTTKRMERNYLSESLRQKLAQPGAKIDRVPQRPTSEQIEQLSQTERAVRLIFKVPTNSGSKKC
jgi:hypothetical protein